MIKCFPLDLNAIVLIYRDNLRVIRSWMERHKWFRSNHKWIESIPCKLHSDSTSLHHNSLGIRIVSFGSFLQDPVGNMKLIVRNCCKLKSCSKWDTDSCLGTATSSTRVDHYSVNTIYRYNATINGAKRTFVPWRSGNYCQAGIYNWDKWSYVMTYEWLHCDFLI